MFAPDPVAIGVIRQWIEKAESDLTAARHLLTLGPRCPTDTVCFHAQQSGEKYIKALLIWHERDFPKTHNLGKLLSLLPPKVRPDLTVEEQQQLTDYATVTRYPGDYGPISRTEARAAVKVARRVRSQVRKKLPKEALRAG